MRRGGKVSKHLSKKEIILNKKKSIIQLNNLLESYISRDDKLRKADLVSKWIKDYVNYLNFEEKFNPKRNIAYKRGNIVKVNLGFNLGSELGGVHYAVVIDNNNKHSSDTITILPMSSLKDNTKVYERDLLIGSEFYNLVNSKHELRLKNVRAQYDKLKALTPSLHALQKLSYSDDYSLEEKEHLITDLENFQSELCKQLDDLNAEIDILEKNKAEIDMMKTGSIVKLEQIRTISKMRIWIPKTTQDPLYDISLSKPTMDKINSKLMELFIFSNNS